MKKKIITILMMTMLTAATTVFALADGASAGTASNALQTGFQSIVSEVTGTILIALPIGLGLIGLVLAIRFGIRWFKSLVSKG
jgi:hypothetical protein